MDMDNPPKRLLKLLKSRVNVEELRRNRN